MPVSIDNALRILRHRGWRIASDSQGAWVIERAALSNAELTAIADTLRVRVASPASTCVEVYLVKGQSDV